jgi:hypothetical protein
LIGFQFRSNNPFLQLLSQLLDGISFDPWSNTKKKLIYLPILNSWI